MYALRLRRAARGRRGQTIVLGTLGVLIISIMMLLTLNVGQAVHEKIRIQQLADAAAFSTATQEARVFNFLAYTNRANIGSLVSAASMHSFMSMASAIPEMFDAAANTFFIHSGLEIAICMTCCLPPYCTANCHHCVHAFQDFDAALNFQDSYREFRDAINNLDDQFKWAMIALDTHMLTIMSAQKALIAEVFNQILQDNITTDLRDMYAPQASGNDQTLCVKNAGSPGFAPPAILGGSRGFADVFERSETIQKFVPTMIANGTRWSSGATNEWFVSRRNLIDALLFSPRAIFQLSEDGKPAQGLTSPIEHEGQGRIIKGPNDPVGKITSDEMGPDGNAVGAYDSGWIMSMGLICFISAFPILSPYDVFVSSGPDGGDHEKKELCSDPSGHTFSCLDTSAGPLSCFTVFDAEPDPGLNFGQPAAYSVIMQDMNVMVGGGKGAWEVDVQTDGRGTISVDLKTEGGPVEVGLANNEYKMGDFGKGVAMSKALAYYHMPRYDTDGWKGHPNFFNPYWKAKLHPFRSSLLSFEARFVLNAGGAGQYTGALAGAPLP